MKGEKFLLGKLPSWNVVHLGQKWEIKESLIEIIVSHILLDIFVELSLNTYDLSGSASIHYLQVLTRTDHKDWTNSWSSLISTFHTSYKQLLNDISKETLGVVVFQIC